MPRVIGVAGPVGAGKSTLVGHLASLLGASAVVRFDDYERTTERSVEAVRGWMHAGADLNEIALPGLPEVLAALKSGQSVAEPPTGRTIEEGGAHVLFETQFGRAHRATGCHIDFLVWIDTPLDVALARKIRQLVEDVSGSADGQVVGFTSWLRVYLANYLEIVHPLLELQRERVRHDADLVLDGMLEPLALARQCEAALRARL